MAVNLSGQVPAEQNNGLVDVEEDLLDERAPDPFVAVVIIERTKRIEDDIKQETRAVVRFKHIEPLSGEDAKTARALLEKAYGKRTGATALELPVEEPEIV